MISGILGIAVFYNAMNIAVWFFEWVSTVPIINLILLLNMSILGIDMITVESFASASMATMAFMDLCTKYDFLDGHNCYKKASRTCGIIFTTFAVLVLVGLYTADGISIGFFSTMIMLGIFSILLLSGEKI